MWRQSARSSLGRATPFRIRIQVPAKTEISAEIEEPISTPATPSPSGTTRITIRTVPKIARKNASAANCAARRSARRYESGTRFSESKNTTGAISRSSGSRCSVPKIRRVSGSASRA